MIYSLFCVVVFFLQMNILSIARTYNTTHFDRARAQHDLKKYLRTYIVLQNSTKIDVSVSAKFKSILYICNEQFLSVSIFSKFLREHKNNLFDTISSGMRNENTYLNRQIRRKLEH